jgi:hypothetical protein
LALVLIDPPADVPPAPTLALVDPPAPTDTCAKARVPAATNAVANSAVRIMVDMV